MRVKQKADTRRWKIVLIFAIALWAGFVTYFFPTLTEPLEKPLLDHHLRNTSSGYGHQRIVVVMIGDKSVAQIGNWPWPTNLYADLIDGPLSGAKTIAYNVDFLSLGNAEGDEEFAQAMRQHGNVVLGARYLVDEDKFLYPREVLRESAARVGIYQTLTSDDKIYRQFQMYAQDKAGTLYPTYMHSILLQSGYDVQIDESTHEMVITNFNHDHLSKIQLDENYATWTINADAEDMEVYEYVDVQEGLVPSSVFDDAVVFIGVSNASERRLISTPDGDVYSSVRTANQLHTALSGFNPSKISSEQEALLVFSACLLCGFVALLLPSVLSFLIPGLITLISFFVSHHLFLQGIFYWPLASLILWSWALFLIIAFIQIKTVSNIADYATIPLQQAFSSNIGSDTEGKERIVRHLQGLEGLFQSVGLHLIEPLIGDEHEFVQKYKEELPDETKDGAAMVIRGVSKQKPKHRVLVSHPKTDPGEPNEYTLLGMKKLDSVYAVQSVLSLVRNVSLYYKALQYGEEKQKMSFNMIKCMVAAIDAKDPITAGHSQRVAQVALQIAQKLDFSDQELEDLELAAIVHDVGKIGIRDSVLHKRGIFSSDEFAEMKTHPRKGISIMSPSGLNKNIVDAILNHHERPDGQGYPGGKTQDEIGIYARIIKISDVYDALLGERQYKKSWPLEKVCDLLYLGRNTEFDAEITDLFLDMIKPEGWVPPETGEGKKTISKETSKKYRCYGIRRIKEANRYLHNAQKGCGAYLEESSNVKNLNIFFGMEWGEPFSADHFLSKRPYLLEYDDVNEVGHFALLLDSETRGIVVYSFLRGFLTSGMIFISDEGGMLEETFSEPINTFSEPINTFGEPIDTEEGCLLWDFGKLFVLRQPNVEGFDAVIAYITKYEFNDNEG